MKEDSKAMKQVNWKAPEEMISVLDFMVYEETEPGKPGNRAEILRRLVMSSAEYKAAEKRLEKQMAVAA